MTELKVGQRFNSLDAIESQLLPPEEASDAQASKPTQDFAFTEQHVVEGVVTLRVLPVGALGANEAMLSHDEFTFPIAKGMGWGEVQYELKAGEMTKVEVTAVIHCPPACCRG